VVRGKHHGTDDGIEAGGVTPAGRDGNAHRSRTTSQLLYSRQDFSRRSVSPHLLLGKHRLSIHSHLEHATGRLDQLDVGLRVCLLQLSRQTGSSRMVVSDYAVLDRYTHLGTSGENRRRESY
jgi:hypothetical protein